MGLRRAAGNSRIIDLYLYDVVLLDGRRLWICREASLLEVVVLSKSGFRRCVAGGRELLPAAVLAFALLVPAACSGGGGGGPTAPDSGPGVASVEGSSFALINQERHNAGRPELMFDPLLADIARHYSERMRDEGFFSHTDPSGANTSTRVRMAGLSFTVLGENLATTSGVSDPARTAHERFLSNPAHRANILDERFTLAGVGVARSGNSYWITQLYLRP